MTAINEDGPDLEPTETEKKMQSLVPFVTHLLVDKDLSRRTAKEYKSRVRQYIEWSEGKLDAETLRRYRDHLHEQGEVKPQTIKQKFLAIHVWARFLAQSGVEIPDFDPIMRKMPRPLPRKRRVPTPQEMDRIWTAAERMPVVTYHDQFVRGRTLAVLALLNDCGLRRREVIRLKVADLALSTHEPEVRIRNSKGGQSRMVPLSDRAVALLSDWIELRQEWMAGREVVPAVQEALFPVNSKHQMSDGAFTHLWKNLLQMAGLGNEEIQPHGVRHRFGSDICALAGLPNAQKALGHASIMTTAAYLHGDMAQVREAIQQLAQRRGETGNPGMSGAGDGAPRTGRTSPQPSRKNQEQPNRYTPQSERSNRFQRRIR